MEYFLNGQTITDILSSASSTTVYIATLLSLIANGLTNLPSSQILYLTLGYLYNINDFNVYIAIVLGTIGNTIGNFILYRLIYSNSNNLNHGLIKLLNLNRDVVEKYNEYFRNKWWGYLILGKMTPSVKVFVPIVCGLSKISVTRALIIFIFGSFFWACGVTFLGYYFGKQASLVQFYLIVTLIYALIGGYVYFKYKRIR